MTTFKKAWDLLLTREKRQAGIILCVIVISSILAVAMVGSIYPFFAIVSNPVGILENPQYQSILSFLGITTPEKLILMSGSITLGVIVFANLFALFKAYVMARYFSMRAHALSSRAFSLQARQPYADFLSTHPTLMSKTVVGAPSETAHGFMEPVGNMISAIVSIVLMMGFLLFLNPWVTLIVFGMFSVCYSIIMRLTSKPLKEKGRIQIEANNQRNKALHELARCARDIRMSGQEEAFIQRFSKYSMVSQRSRVAVNFWSQIPRFGLQILFFGGVVCAGMGVVLFSSSPEAAQETLVNALPLTGVFVMAGQRMIPEMQSIYASFGKIAFGTPSVELLSDAMIRMQEKQIILTKASPLNFQSLDIKNVDFSYASKTTPALSDVSLSIQKGEKVALVGPSGSGKSSLIQILMGLVDPDSGSMRVNEKEMTPALAISWRKTIAQVPQDVVVLSDTVSRNVALGVADKDIDESRVREVLQMVHLTDWLEGLEQGLESEISSGSSALSGGQRQRLGIARALYLDGDVVILDEATSALDAQTQDSVLSLMNEVFKDKTVISIAHRPEALKGLQRQITLHEGRIIEDKPVSL